MFGGRHRLIIVTVFTVLSLLAVHAAANMLSREEAEEIWEGLLRAERYVSLSFHSRTGSSPDEYRPKEKILHVQDFREGYIWGFFGLSSGGGWDIEGRLEAEVETERGILQLYSKETTRWHPGFWWIVMPWYDLEKWPQWEFRVILRDPVHRQEIQTLKTIPVPTKEVIKGRRGVDGIYPPGEEVCPLGQRCPRGELRYDAISKMATIQILGVYHPFTVEASLSQVTTPTEGEAQ